MRIDVAKHIGAIVREVRSLQKDGKPAHAVIAQRDYPTDIDDLWDAVTNLERIPRWFAPVTGDPKLGGTYAVQGNASGTITECKPPKSFALTWEFGGGVSWVTVTLSELDSETTRLELVHTAHVEPEFTEKYGPGAVGVGWDLSLLGLALHIETGESKPPEADNEWLQTDNYRQFAGTSSDGWRDAAIANGTDREQATRAGAATTAFYTGTEPPA